MTDAAKIRRRSRPPGVPDDGRRIITAGDRDFLVELIIHHLPSSFHVTAERRMVVAVNNVTWLVTSNQDGRQ